MRYSEFVEVTCKVCGKTFCKEVHRKGYSQPVDEQFIDWILEQEHVCPACYHEQKEAAEAKEAEEKGYCRPSFIDSTWNGKIYGYGTQKSIYVKGVKMVLTPEQVGEVAYYAWEIGKITKEQFAEYAKILNLPTFVQGFWNGKVYGNINPHIYVNCKKMYLTPDMVKAILQYKLSLKQAA